MAMWEGGNSELPADLVGQIPISDLTANGRVLK